MPTGHENIMDLYGVWVIFVGVGWHGLMKDKVNFYVF